MKNIHILPTDKHSRLIKNNRGYALITDEFTWSDLDFIQAKFQHIYITSDEEIKEGDWVVLTTINKLVKVEYNLQKQVLEDYNKNHKKIILTTDQDLIKDGVQAIDDEFLEWFVKNQSCEEVEVRSFIDAFEWRTIYKIIIPKEEKDYTALLKPVGTKQETIEEIAERYYEDEVSINAFINGYKLAKEQFKTNKI